MNKTLLSFGHGYSAQALERLLLPQGWRIIGTTRSADKARELARTGVEMLVFPDDEAIGAIRSALSRSTHVLVSAGPTERGDPVLSVLRDDFARAAPALSWVGYLSTTGVYGDHEGGWVDETTPLAPSTIRGQWRKAAEEGWAAVPDLPLHVFRLAGIYGPGRGPFAKLQNGTARRIVKPGQVFSRIHVDDIAQTLAASIAKPDPGAVYNLCDDDPAPPEDVLAYAANLLGVSVPPEVPFDQADMSPLARSFYAENKRVRNDRIKAELGVTLKYPDFRAGLRALFERLE